MDSKYLFAQITDLFRKRRDQILSKKPGAISHSKHPKIIWVSMINHPRPTSAVKVNLLSQRDKFNFITDELAAEFGFYIMDIHACKHNCYFDRQSELNSLGKEAYWKDLNYIFKRFDANDNNFDLKPSASRTAATRHSQSFMGQSRHQTIRSDRDNHRRLPTPPTQSTGTQRYKIDYHRN